ncbi:Proline-rich receptor-like protein kinase PERK3, partial [Bienertia sinuspersici]
MSIFNLIIIALNMLIILQLHQTSSTKHTPQYVHHYCPSGDFTYTSGSTFESNLTNTLLNILPANVSLATVSKLTAGEANSLSYCRGDVSSSECHDCVEAAARNIIQRCQFHKEGIIWYEECTLRYANRSNIFSNDDVDVTPNHRHYNFSGTFRYLEQNERIFTSLMNRLIHEAAYVGNKSGFAIGESNLSTTNWLLRSLVQCRPDLGSSQCETCLRQALKQRDGWSTPMVFLPSCSIQFDMYPYATVNQSSLADHPRKFTWLNLVWATACFSRRRIVGAGGFGYVYKGTLFDGTQVAVKRLNVSGSFQGNDQFVAEVEAISNLKHPNIVSLKGYCIFFRERLLVYEYVPNKTLEHHLHGNGQEFLWEKRMNLALSLAEVHTCCSYVDPDYHTSEHLTMKSDVFAFGIVLLELITGRKAITEIGQHITNWVCSHICTIWPLIKEAVLAGNFDGIVDEKLGATYDHGQLNCMLICAATCVHNLSHERPTMRQVAQVLNRVIKSTTFQLGVSIRVAELANLLFLNQVAEVLKGSKESKEICLELKERLMRFWQVEAQRRIYGEGNLIISPETMMEQITNDE